MNDLLPLKIAFSGGRSSAVMTKLCLDKWRGKREIVVLFANTGLEHPATLNFVRDCDINWGFNVVWLEAVVHSEDGIGNTHKIVTYETASRNGEPFAATIAKYGIPNATSPKCTDNLKLAPMASYVRSLDWGKYETAIGIRADEIDRMSSRQHKQRLIYPLIDANITKSQVNAIMAKQSWDLKLPGDHYGNCVACWKKSDRKLLTVAAGSPQSFAFFSEMESKYGAVRVDGYRATAPDGRRYFYRKHRPASWFVESASVKKFEPYRDQVQGSIWDDELDLGGSCDQGCEIYSNQN
jgi:hypothetical protein